MSEQTTTIESEFQKMCLSAYGEQELDPGQRLELKLSFCRGIMYGHAATILAVKDGNKRLNLLEILHREIVNEIRAENGVKPLFDPILCGCALPGVEKPCGYCREGGYQEDEKKEAES